MTKCTNISHLQPLSHADRHEHTHMHTHIHTLALSAANTAPMSGTPQPPLSSSTTQAPNTHSVSGSVVAATMSAIWLPNSYTTSDEGVSIHTRTHTCMDTYVCTHMHTLSQLMVAPNF